MDKDTKPARLIIADDHALLRSGIRSMLYGEPDLEVVGEAADGAEALELCRRLQPNLVLMDVRMPKMDGLAATRAIKEEFPKTSVVMVTMQEDPDYLFEAVIAGAAGYVLKGATPEQLTDAVRQVLDGEFLFNQKLTIDLLRSMAAREKSSVSPSGVAATEESISEPPRAKRRSYVSSPRARPTPRSRASSLLAPAPSRTTCATLSPNSASPTAPRPPSGPWNSACSRPASDQAYVASGAACASMRSCTQAMASSAPAIRAVASAGEILPCCSSATTLARKL